MDMEIETTAKSYQMVHVRQREQETMKLIPLKTAEMAYRCRKTHRDRHVRHPLSLARLCDQNSSWADI
jgi:hypothetical protein